MEKSLQQLYDEIISLRLPMVRDFEPADFNSYIAVGFLPNHDINMMIGRVVQVREEWGAYGSNQVFIRCSDGNLHCHENQFFYKAPARFNSRLNELFKESPLDPVGIAYSLSGKQKRKGFIIKSKVKEGETTPMREVQKSIHLKIEQLLEKAVK